MRILSKIEYIGLEIKWGFQRMFRGYDDRARWGLYSYLTDIIIPNLEWLKAAKHGVPGMVIEGNEPMETSFNRWDEILNKMIIAFKIIQEDDWETERANREIKEEGLALFAKYYEGLWD